MNYCGLPLEAQTLTKQLFASRHATYNTGKSGHRRSARSYTTLQTWALVEAGTLHAALQFFRAQVTFHGVWGRTGADTNLSLYAFREENDAKKPDWYRDFHVLLALVRIKPPN